MGYYFPNPSLLVVTLSEEGRVQCRPNTTREGGVQFKLNIRGHFEQIPLTTNVDVLFCWCQGRPL